MKRLIAALIALAGLIVGATTLRGAIAPDEIRREVETTLAGWLGAPVRVAGEAHASLLPTPRLRWTDAAIADASGATLVTSTEIEAPISLAALLSGRVETDGLVLRGARLKLGAEALRSLAATARLFALPPIDLRLENARLEIARPTGVETIEALDLTIAHKAVGAGLELDGKGRWRGVTTTATAEVDRIPDGAAALIVYRQDGATTTALSWARVAVGASSGIEVYASPGKCGTEPDGLTAPAPGDTVALAWVDQFGRRSPLSTALVVK